jgi:Protein of unknown function (DUF2971)
MSTPLLFKYRSLADQCAEKYAESFVTQPALWFAAAHSLNDPFELRPVHTINGKPLPADISADLNASLIEHAGVCCLSRVNDSIPMWSYYADKHSGFCVGFDAEGLAQVGDLAVEVQYGNAYPTLEFLGIDLNRLHEGVTLRHMTTKSSQWAHEQEVRLLSLSRSFYRPQRAEPAIGHHGPGRHVYAAHLLRSVIFGARMDADRRSRVRSWAESRGHGVEFYECLLSQDAFRIDLSRIA